MEADLSPSEDYDKVVEAMKCVLGAVVSPREERGGRVVLRSEDADSLVRIHDQLRDRRVRGAARRLARSGREGGRVRLMVNRQAAAVGIIALCGSPEESPLGPLFLTIESDDVEGILDWLTAFPG